MMELVALIMYLLPMESGVAIRLVKSKNFALFICRSGHF